LFSTKRLWGVGAWLRDTGRGPQEIAKIAKIAGIAKIENPKESPESRVIADIGKAKSLIPEQPGFTTF